MSIHEYNQIIKRADDESVALKIKVTDYSTTGAVTINDSTVTVTVDATTTAMDLSTTAYDTLGEFADALNALSGVEATIFDGLRSETTKTDYLAMIGPAGTLTTDETMGATGTDGVSLGWDSSNLHKYYVAIQQEDLPSKATAGYETTDAAFENLIYEVRAKLTDTNCTNTLSIYQCVGTTETEVWTLTGAATSDEQILFSDDTVPISGGDPKTAGRLVAVLTCDTTHAATWIEARGKSVNRCRESIDR